MMHGTLKEALRSPGFRSLALLLLCWVAATASPQHLEVVGLFKDAAVLLIDERQVMLRVGERTEEGVLLVSASSEQAVVEYEGVVTTLSLSRRMSSVFKKPERESVAIPPNGTGQYIVGGVINGLPVRFLVDTGASVVALSEVHARALGLNYRSGDKIETATASGVTVSWRITLDSVQVGAIRLNNVEAAVLEGDHPLDVLLGMSYLNYVELTNADGVLMLRSKL